MTATQSATQYREEFAARPDMYLCAGVAAHALVCAHPGIDEKSARRYFQYHWMNGVPAHEALDLMNTPAGELPKGLCEQ